MTDHTLTEEDGRNDFSSSTRELLAKRSGYICAYPSCKRMTVARSDDRESGFTMIGIAAHITAASKNGPRYDPDMSVEERAGETNGIWTCQIHGKFIDDNPSKCSIDELRRWKAQHEKWVFDRVESGVELFNRGVCRLRFGNVGMFSDDFVISLGRNNVLVGVEESGKTTVCQILSAFSGGDHWKQFNDRFSFSKRSACRAHIQLYLQSNHKTTAIRLSPQVMSGGRRKADNARQRVHIEINGCPTPDWPRSLLRVLYFESQLYHMHYSEPKDTFVKALRYLANVLGTDEDLVWDSLREELFASSTFGNRFRRTGHRKVEILVPDGRTSFLPHGGLSFTEQQMAFLDIALKLASCGSRNENWLYVFDTAFFQRLNQQRKSLVFKKLTELDSSNVQTLFCLNSKEDAEVLRDIQSDKWVNAEHFGNLTLHSFL
jgi:hypothetical protein